MAGSIILENAQPKTKHVLYAKNQGTLQSAAVKKIGDNIQVNKPDEVIPHDYLQMIEALDLEQLVTFPTHRLGNTLTMSSKKFISLVKY